MSARASRGSQQTHEPQGTGVDSLRDLYEEIGGMSTCRMLSERFHDRIARDPVLRALFPRDMAPTTEYLALFLAERLGGPADYAARRGKTSLQCRHAHVPIGAPEAEKWLGHMFAVLDEVGIAESVQTELRAYFRETAGSLSDPFLPLYHLPLEELRQVLSDDPSLATSCDHGRTLLWMAAREWDAPRVEMLLECGADANARDLLGHDPLYHAVSAFAPGREGDGRAVVTLLIEHGADVQGRSGPGRLTALHASARRGTVSIADRLLAAGADVDAADSKGETPLRRAVNCGQEAMVRLLLEHGANPMLADRQGATPLDVARRDGIRDALRNAIQSG